MNMPIYDVIKISHEKKKITTREITKSTQDMLKILQRLVQCKENLNNEAIDFKFNWKNIIREIKKAFLYVTAKKKHLDSLNNDDNSNYFKILQAQIILKKEISTFNYKHTIIRNKMIKIMVNTQLLYNRTVSILKDELTQFYKCLNIGHNSIQSSNSTIWHLIDLCDIKKLDKESIDKITEHKDTLTINWNEKKKLNIKPFTDTNGFEWLPIQQPLNPCFICLKEVHYFGMHCEALRACFHTECLYDKSIEESIAERFNSSSKYMVYYGDDLLVTYFVKYCVEIIDMNFIKTDGLYRISPSLGVAKTTHDKILLSQSLDANEKKSAVLTSALKMYLRGKHYAIIDKNFHKTFIKSAKEHNIKQMKQDLKRIPTSNYKTLQYLVRHLLRVSYLEEFTRMTNKNLSIIFGPIIFRDDESKASLERNADQVNTLNFILDNQSLVL
ncbi:hypothetical protein A3Q56_05312 [Intoshia linei]|uniref:Rho-GAP domain-containing protein n=1 Tax=Intoshia linei TaxID=1819745 RepID=A0A177AY79_9BILA|nr:hypothetical protein A3Q56_05312 [Intoshia linei]